MDFFKKRQKEQCEVIVINENIIEVDGERFHRNRYRLIYKFNINNSKFSAMSLTIVANQLVSGTLGLLDTVTNNPVTSSFANSVATSDTPGAFTAAIDGAGNVVVTGVAAGAGTLTVSADCSYVDSTGANQTKNLSTTIDVTISEVITADSVQLVVSFGAPVNQ